MRKAWLGLGLLGFALLGGCGDDDEEGSAANPVQACNNLMNVLCKKIFGCLTDAQEDAGAAIWGNNEADCRTKLQGENCDEEMVRCDSGETYDSGKAQECIDQTESLSCDEITNFGSATPAACDQVCQ